MKTIGEGTWTDRFDRQLVAYDDPETGDRRVRILEDGIEVANVGGGKTDEENARMAEQGVVPHWHTLHQQFLTHHFSDRTDGEGRPITCEVGQTSRHGWNQSLQAPGESFDAAKPVTMEDWKRVADAVRSHLRSINCTHRQRALVMPSATPRADGTIEITYSYVQMESHRVSPDDDLEAHCCEMRSRLTRWDGQSGDVLGAAPASDVAVSAVAKPGLVRRK